MTQPDIDSQVAAFRDQIADLAAIEPAQIASDVGSLATAMHSAPNHNLAAVALREFYDSHTEEYSQAVILGALSALSVTILVSDPADSLSGPEGMLARLMRLAWAVRGLGITLGSLQLFLGGAR